VSPRAVSGTRRRTYSLPLFLCLLAGIAAAPRPAQAEAATALDPIVVTPTATALSLSDVPAPVIVITRREILRSGALDLVQLLRFYAGIDVAQTGGPGQPASVFLQGASSGQTLVLIDGVEVNGGNLGLAPLADIPLTDVERVEIVEGPSSSLYGSDGIGGVIDILTRGNARRLHAHASVAYGSYGTRSLDVGGADGGGRFAAGADFSRTLVRGFPPLVGSGIDAGTTESLLNAFARWRPSARGNLVARLWQSRGTTGYLNYEGLPRSENFRDRLVLLRGRLRLASGVHARLTLDDYEERLLQNQRPDFARTRREGLDARVSFTRLPAQRLLVGVSLRHEHDSSLVYGTAYDQGFRLLAPYAEDIVTTGRNRFVASARLSDYSTFGAHRTWSLADVYRWASGTSLGVEWGTGFRAPPAEDLYGYGGNPALAPESSHTLEIVARQWMSDDARLTLNLYLSRIDDLIVYLGPSALYPEGINENVGRTQTRGASLSLAWLPRPWSLRARLDVQQPRDLETGTVLARRSERSASLLLGRRLAGGEIGLDLLAVGPRPDSPYTTVIDPGYVLTDLDGRWPLPGPLTLGVRIGNLLDVHYTEVSGYQTAGRSILLALRWDL
jgi:vitamin B12 transporter